MDCEEPRQQLLEVAFRVSCQPQNSPGKFEKPMEEETKSKENTRSCPIAHKSFGVTIDRVMELKATKTSPEN